MKNLAATGGPVAAGITAAIAAAKAFIGILKEGTEAYKVQEKAEGALQAAAANNPYLSAESVQRLKDYALMIGDNVFLKQKEFDKQYFQDGHFYSCLTIKAKRWNFVSRDSKYDIINKDFLQNCRDAEQFDFGGYPIKRSNLWYNGIHYGNKIGNKIYPIGAGQLIAARVVNKDTEKNEEPKNGSRCFVLIKHQVIVAEKLQDFFVCYMHLKPIEDLGSYIQSSRKTNIKWLDELIKRSKKTNRIRYGIENTEFYSLNDTEGKKSVGKLPSSGVFIVNDEKNEKETEYIFFINLY